MKTQSHKQTKTKNMNTIDEIKKFPVEVKICFNKPTAKYAESYQLMINDRYTSFIYEHVAIQIAVDLQLEINDEYPNAIFYTSTECEIAIKYYKYKGKYALTIFKNNQQFQYPLQKSQTANYLIPKLREILNTGETEVLNIF